MSPLGSRACIKGQFTPRETTCSAIRFAIRDFQEKKIFLQVIRPQIRALVIGKGLISLLKARALSTTWATLIMEIPQ